MIYRDSDAGFVFAVKKTDLDVGGELPRGFVDVTAQKGRWVLSSVELASTFKHRGCSGKLENS